MNDTDLACSFLLAGRLTGWLAADLILEHHYLLNVLCYPNVFM